MDAFRDEVLDQKTNVVTKRVVRYYMKNPTVINFGNRPMMAGEGVKDWPAVVYIPVDAIVAIAGFTNNQQFAQILGTSSVVPEFHSTPR